MVPGLPFIVARRMRAERERRGWGRRSFGERLDPKLTRLQVWRLETGATEISAELAQRAADLFGIPVGDLFVEFEVAA